MSLIVMKQNYPPNVVKSGNPGSKRATIGHAASLIIILNEDGYIYDFLFFEGLQLQCIQQSTVHAFDEVKVNRVGLCRITPHKLLIAIETTCGLKGILYTILGMPCYNLLNKERLLSGRKLISGSRLRLHMNV